MKRIHLKKAVGVGLVAFNISLPSAAAELMADLSIGVKDLQGNFLKCNPYLQPTCSLTVTCMSPTPATVTVTNSSGAVATNVTASPLPTGVTASTCPSIPAGGSCSINLYSTANNGSTTTVTVAGTNTTNNPTFTLIVQGCVG